MKKLCYILAALALAACGAGNRAPQAGALLADLEKIAAAAPGRVGVAIISDSGDTLTLNNSADYPLMSMFKLHQTLAAAAVLDSLGAALDSTLTVAASEIDSTTWSPMLKSYSADGFQISLGELFDYTLIHSDNNASNILFGRIASAPATDSIIHRILPGAEFNISWTEAQMKAHHELAYENRTSPLAYACLLDRVFADSIVSPAKQEHIRRAMRACDTGLGRIAAGLPADTALRFAHRTGSGYVNDRGEIVAVNDGGHIVLPSGRSYVLVVLLKDYAGTQAGADSVIALVSERVSAYFGG